MPSYAPEACIAGRGWLMDGKRAATAGGWSDMEDRAVRVTINRRRKLIPVRPGMRLAPEETPDGA